MNGIKSLKNKKIKGVNLGNWLVLEKWMAPEVFEGIAAEDETWFMRDLSLDEAYNRLKVHRDTYIQKKDFEKIAAMGLNLVRIPVPYFIFGDRHPHPGCIEYLDKAFAWAGDTSLKVLIDLHTAPGCQNTYDNGGLAGVCKFGTDPKEVGFVLTVLERLAERYKDRDELFGIEVLNEPAGWAVFHTSPTRHAARDKDEAAGSKPLSIKFLKSFYKEAYRRIRKHLPEQKAVVFHDGFRLEAWQDFFKKNGMKNVYIDAHFYLHAMEMFVPIKNMLSYWIYVNIERLRIKFAARFTPVIIGEWSLSTSYGSKIRKNKDMSESELKALRKKRFNQVYRLQRKAWDESAGWIYWSWKLGSDTDKPLDDFAKNAWDFRRCVKNGWLPDKF